MLTPKDFLSVERSVLPPRASSLPTATHHRLLSHSVGQILIKIFRFRDLFIILHIHIYRTKKIPETGVCAPIADGFRKKVFDTFPYMYWYSEVIDSTLKSLKSLNNMVDRSGWPMLYRWPSFLSEISIVAKKKLVLLKLSAECHMLAVVILFSWVSAITRILDNCWRQ